MKGLSCQLIMTSIIESSLTLSPLQTYIKESKITGITEHKAPFNFLHCMYFNILKENLKIDQIPHW